ncbi:MAG TPA: HIT domain-containing protein [Gemmatales bacterium]|nr:HIT domain-containing protein [Gemmatales bacterium]
MSASASSPPPDDPRLQRLWAPWRLDYVVRAASEPRPECFICHGLAANDDPAHLIACRTATAVVVLNKYPYNNGHLLIAPQAHKAHPRDLTQDETLDVQQTLTRLIDVIDGLMQPDGYNIGVNLGRVAGAGLPGHLHWHLVPRWNGDTNFMPILGEAKVIVQSLDSLLELLRERLQ